MQYEADYEAGKQRGRADTETAMSHLRNVFPQGAYTLPDDMRRRAVWLHGYAGGMLARLANEGPQ